MIPIMGIILEPLVECERLCSIGGSNRFQACISRALRLPGQCIRNLRVIKVSFGSMIANARLSASRIRRRIVSSSAFSDGMNSELWFHALPVSGSRSESSTVGSEVSSLIYMSGAYNPLSNSPVFASIPVFQSIMPLMINSFQTILFCCWLPVCMMFAWNHNHRSAEYHSQEDSICARILSERSMRIQSHVVPLLTMAMVSVLFSNGASFS